MPLFGWSQEEIYFVAERAYGFYRQGRVREAAVLFEGLVAVDPENAYCRKALAAACIALGEHWQGIQHLSAVITRDPHDIDALARRCEAFLEAGRIVGARRDFDTLIAHPEGIESARRLRMRFLPSNGNRTIQTEASQLPKPHLDN